MSRLSSFLLLILTLLLLPGPAIAQNKDYGTWLGLEVSKKLTKNFEVELEEEVRIVEKFSELGRFVTSLGGAYSLNEFLKAGAGYTWIKRHDVKDNYWEDRHRMYLFLTGKIKWDRLTFLLREKFQKTYYNPDVNDFDYSPQNNLRSKLEIKYDPVNSPMEPYISTEIFYQLNNPDGNEAEDIRYTAGVEFPLSKNLNLDTYLRIDREMNITNPDHQYVAGITLKWKL